MKIGNIEDYVKYIGTDVSQLERDVYKYTACGAWIKWSDNDMTIGSIVEGSDAEFSRTFTFPATTEEIDAWLDELDELTDETWTQANET